MFNEPSNIWIVAASAIAGLALLQAARAASKRNRLPLPPGPKGLPLIGNLLDIPQIKPWRVYNEWAEQYGDVIYFNALGQNFVVLNTLTAANDLLSSRAANYSNRPESPIIDIAGAAWALVLKNYGSEWRDHRRTFHRFYNQTQVSQFRPIIEDEVARLLSGLLSTPQSFHKVTKEFFGLSIMRVAYGSEDYEYNKHLIREADRWNDAFHDYLKPGRLLVGVLHSLRHVPSWFPGAGWKLSLQEINALGEQATRGPFEVSKKKFEEGVQNDQGLNIATRLIADLPPPDAPETPGREEVARHVTAMGYLAGIDSSESSAMALIYALATNEKVQQKAQEEIDRVVGAYRLPNFGDFDHLPYIQAVVKEVSRWHSVVPLCVPHVSLHEDEYKGYRIPAKSIILPNTWAIMHDPNQFDDPMAFKPERYLKDGKLNPDIMDPEAAAFGYGRRICPGRHFSGEALAMLVASILACFDIRPPKDEHGREVQMGPMDMASVMIAAPVPFECSITPRSQQHAHLIRTMADTK
ncbi:cytochrome P450 [Coprinopsis sp. MPI-PUGE-AT-0042]|nr:cytochrome P450 [Coprinopsis sp. MPI-PUGE-AT-0042]